MLSLKYSNPKNITNNKCPKFKFNIILDKRVFIGGEVLFGRLDLIITSSSSVQLGEILVELIGYEGLLIIIMVEFKDKSDELIESFLSSSICLQGENLPLTQAVRGFNSQGFWMANKGRFIFPFAFKLPLEIPSSFTFKTLLAVKYKVTALIQYKYHGRSDTAYASVETNVFEYVDVKNSYFTSPISRKIQDSPWFGRGLVQVEAFMTSPLAISGQEIRIDLKIVNNSSKKIQGIKLYLYKTLESLSNISSRKFETHEITEYAPLTVRNSDFTVHAHESKFLASTIKIPSGIYSVSRAILGEVNCWIQISLGMGLFNSDIVLSVPVAIYDPLSLLPTPNYNDNIHDQMASSSKDQRQVSLPKNIPIVNSGVMSKSLSPKRYYEKNILENLSPPNRSLPWSADFDDARSDDGISFSDSRNISIL